VAVALLAPDRILLGTIPAAAGEALCLAPLRGKLAALVRPEALEGLEVAAASLGARGPALAGLCAALEGMQGTAGAP